jgi:hypothetical protein
MSLAEGVKRALQKLASKEKASGAARFFKTAPV